MSLASTLPPKPPPKAPPLPGKTNGPAKVFAMGGITKAECHRIIIYGPGGIGKTTLACLLAKLRGPVGFLDLERSLNVLQPKLGGLNVKQVGPLETWDDLRGALAAPIWSECKTVVIDSGSKAEELATEWTLKNVPHEKGHRITRLEDYGFGKGVQHVYETYLNLFADLDQHVRHGRNVVLVCHDVTATVPNPTGEDFLRWEPWLQHPKSQNNSIRLKAKEWSDHLFHVGYDVVVNKDGVAQGSGSRTIYPSERPWCMAKSRIIADPIQYLDGDDSLWAELFGKEGNV